jgi:protein Tex
VKVKVQEVDAARKRIGLTLRLNDDTAPVRRATSDRRPIGSGAPRHNAAKRPAESPASASGAMAAAFAKLRK